jgi:hypothetical protein
MTSTPDSQPQVTIIWREVLNHLHRGIVVSGTNITQFTGNPAFTLQLIRLQ